MQALDLATVAAEAVRICADLVQINTVNPYSGDPEPGSERAGQDYLEPLFKEVGAKISRFEPPADIYERMGVLGPRNRSFAGRPNLVAEITFGDGQGPRLLIHGHMDTVGVAGMSIEPFSATVENGRMWGRGTSDEKGGLAAAIAAIRELARKGQELRGSILFMSTVDEECDGGGAGVLACLDQGVTADEVICVDGPFQLHIGGNGVATAQIKLTGGGGHASQSDRPPSAIERGLVVAQAIQEFRKKRLQTQKAAVNLGVFRSGTHPSQVAIEATLGVNLTYTHTEALAAQQAGLGYNGTQVRQAFTEAVLKAEPTAEILWVKDVLPFSTLEDHALVQGLSKVHEELLGVAPERKLLEGWSDTCYMTPLAGLPTVIFGAGSPGKAHTPDEYVELAQVENCAKVLATFLYRRLAI